MREIIEEQIKIVRNPKDDDEGSMISWFKGELYTLDWVLDLLEKAPPITGEA